MNNKLVIFGFGAVVGWLAYGLFLGYSINKAIESSNGNAVS